MSKAVVRIAAGWAVAGFLLLLLPAPGHSAGFRSRMKEKYDPYIQTIAAEHGVDADFVHAVITAESAYNRYAISRAGAQGLMQLMPSTASAYGVKDVFDPEDNIRGGVKFLKMLLRLYNGNLKKTLAAYNAGQEAVKKYGGIPPTPKRGHTSAGSWPPTRPRRLRDEPGFTSSETPAAESF